MVLFDANVLVHAHVAKSPYHTVARRIRDEAAVGHLEACLSPQVLCEFFAVCTDPRFVQPALSSAQVRAELKTYWSASEFKRILPKETTLLRMFQLLEAHPVKQQAIFDVFLAATMLDNDVRTIYTENVKDFAVYKELRAINPFGTLTLQ